MALLARQYLTHQLPATGCEVVAAQANPVHRRVGVGGHIDGAHHIACQHGAVAQGQRFVAAGAAWAEGSQNGAAGRLHRQKSRFRHLFGMLGLARVAADEVGDGRQIIDIELGQVGLLGQICRQRHYVAVVWKQQGLAELGAMQLYLGEVLVLEPFHQQQVEPGLVEAGQQGVKRGLGVGRLDDAGVTTARSRHHLIRPRLAQAVAVLARLVGVKVVMGVLEHTQAQTAAYQNGDELFQQRCLASTAPGGKAEQGKSGGRCHDAVAPYRGSVDEFSRRAS